MLKKLILIGSVIICSLDAFEITTESYPYDSMPAEFKEHAFEGSHLTIIKLLELPPNAKINVAEYRLTANRNVEVGQSNETIAIYSLGYTPGDPVTYSFRDPKNHIKKEVTVVPNPLYTKSKTGAIVDAKISMLYPASYAISLEGFEPNEELLFQSSSYGEFMEQKIVCKEKSCLMYMPGVAYKDGGIAKVKLTRTSGEVLSLELPWGLEWVKYNVYYQDGKVMSIIDDAEYLKKNPHVAKYFSTARN